MTQKFQADANVLNYVAAADVANGEVLKLGVRVGVAVSAIANGATGIVRVRGVFSVAKASADVVAQGAQLYWDDSAKVMTTTASGNTPAGYAAKAAGAGITTVEVSINA